MEMEAADGRKIMEFLIALRGFVVDNGFNPVLTIANGSDEDIGLIVSVNSAVITSPEEFFEITFHAYTAYCVDNKIRAEQGIKVWLNGLQTVLDKSKPEHH